MTTADIAHVLGLFGGVGIVLLLVAIYIAAFTWPIMIWSIARNIRRSRIALEQLAETMSLPSHRA
jgi:hypothetical protein